MSNANLATWLDASDAATITSGYVSTGVTSTTSALGLFLDPDRLPTSADLSDNIPIGSKIEVGTDVYTVTNATTSYLEVSPNVMRSYSNVTINRLGISKWADKSGGTGRDLKSPVVLANFVSTEITSANEPSYVTAAGGLSYINFTNTGTNLTAQYLQGSGTPTYGITGDRSLVFLTQINSFSTAGGGSDGQGTYLFDRNPDLVSGTPLFSIKFIGSTLSEQIRDDAGNLASTASGITTPTSGQYLNMSLVRSGTSDNFYSNGTAGNTSVSTGTSTMQPLCITYHAGDANNSGQSQNLNMYEVILTSNTLSTTYRQLEEGYLAWKWGRQGDLANGHPHKTAAGSSGYTNDLVGIGRVSATDSVAATRSTNGLGFSSGTTFLQDNGDYLTAIDNGADGTTISSGNIARLNRIWYINKTDAGSHAGGNVTVYFDYAMLSGGTIPSNTTGSYQLIYSTNGTFSSSSTVVASSATAIVGTQIQFTLNATALADGYYTLKSCSVASTFDYANSPYCTSGSNATVTLINAGGLTSSSGTFSATPSISTANLSTSTGKIIVSAVATGTYTIQNAVTVSTGGGHTCTSTSTSTVIIEPGGQWVGSVNSDWNNTGNWPCGSIPTSTSNIVIPSGVTNFPVISATEQAFVNNITINSGASLTVNGGLNVFGTITSTSGITATSGSIEMRGTTAQSIGGNMLNSKTIFNLTDSNTNTVTGLTIADSLYVTGTMGFATTPSTKLKTNDVLVLVSNAITTASIGQIAETGGVPKAVITGNVTVQRYFPNHRRWRLITAPVASTQSINAAWQEGAVSTTTPLSNPNPHPGFGTHISGPTSGAYRSGLGYDQTPTNSASIATVSNATSWFSIPNTISTAVTAYQGYMIFIRGGRDYTISSSTQFTVATNATLRTVGTVRTGLQSIATTAGFNIIGNPYPASINLNTVLTNSGTSGIANTFYVWDPNIASAANVASGTGGWVTLTRVGSVYVATVYSSGGTFDATANGGFDISGNIQSGAAFMVNAATAGHIAIDEAAKVLTNTGETYLFRPTSGNDTAVTTTAPMPAMLSTALYATTTDSTHVPVYAADGTLNVFSSEFSNDVSWDKDAQKATNTNENLAILKSGQLIAIEKSAPVNSGDTIFLYDKSLTQSSYQFNITAKNFNRPDLNAILVDSATHTRTPITLGDSANTVVNFAITSDAATKATNRFYISFKYAPGSVKYTAVTATQQDKNIAVQWIVNNQLNIKEYVLEKSIDNENFYPVDTTIATGDNTSTITYNWLDEKAVTGDNYYRIRSIDNTGNVQYSKTVDVVIGKGIITGLAIYPNPVTNNTLQLQMNELPAGEYNIRIMNTSGQVILATAINHGTSSETKPIMLSKDLAAGFYILEVVHPDKTITNINFENQ
ncbi:MAG TPA: T9SS type A sorting domain-containing protein [Ferruginibacter sp.]|nr:T9SS type A sorting domain-containing protein [Ferruginibacter sp.]